jgi:EmrB/QacA subfamily drug resistance transporter
MATLDGSIVNVALPAVGRQLTANIGGLEWVVTAYLLVISATLLASGRHGDILGHRRVFVGGMLVFTVGSGLCGFAWSVPALVASRMVQALGASAMMSMAPAALTAIFPREKRGRALGAISSVVAAGLTAGPPIGGLLVQHLSWRAIFFVNLPIGVAGAIWAARSLPPGSEAPGARFDVRGAIWFGAALAAAIGAVEAAPGSGRAALALLAIAAAAAVGLAHRERAAPSPLIDASLFRDRTFAFGLAAGLLSYAALFTQALLSPFYLSQVKGLDEGGMGLMMTAVPLALSVTSPVAGWLSDRFGSRALCLAGAGVLAAGLFSMSLAGSADSLPSLAARFAVEGAGMGLFQPPNNSAVMGSLPRQRLGSGGGMLATVRNLGMVFGVALAGALFAAKAGNGTDTSAFLEGWRLALSAGAVLAVAAGVLSLVMGKSARAT